MTEPIASIVIVNWNAKSDLLACLDSLAHDPPQSPWEVIVVDNASVDNSVDEVRRSAPWARVIDNPTNRGLAAGNNQGIARGRGEIVIVANPDVIFLPGAVDELVDLLHRRPRAAFAFARLLNEDGSVQTCAGSLPRLTEALLGRNHQARVRRAPSQQSFWWDGWRHDEEIQIGHGGEACYAVRRSAIDAIGPQDERFVLDWEGLDWCARALEAGWEAWFCPRAEVKHIGSRSITQARFRWVAESHRGMYRYFARTSPRRAKPFLAAIIAARAVLKVLAVAAGRGFYQRHLNRER